MIPASIPASTDPALWVAGLIGSPWEPGASDCWGLASLLQRTLFRRDLPWSEGQSAGAQLRDVLETLKASDIERHWQPVQDPVHGDLVLMWDGLRPRHIGTWLEFQEAGLVGIVHSTRNTGVTCDGLAQARADWSRIEFRRYASDTVGAVAGLHDDPFFRNLWRPSLIVVADALDPLNDVEVIDLDNGLTVAEAVARLPDAHERWVILNDTPLLRLNRATGEAEWDRQLSPADVLWALPPLPLDDDRGSAVLGTVLTIIASLAAPYAAAAILGQSASSLSFGGKLLSAGIAIGANLLIANFMPSGDVIAPLANPDPTYSFGQVQNQLRPGAVVPVIYGTMLRAPDLLAAPWAEFVENDQIIHILLCLGQGTHHLREILIGDTPVWTEANGYTGAIEDFEHELVTPGGEVTLFPSSVAVISEVEAIDVVEPDPTDGVVEIGPFVAVPSDATATELIYDFVFPGGLFTAASGIGSTSVTWKVEAQQIDASGNALGFWVTLETLTETNATTTPIRLTKRYTVARGRYRTKVTRTSASTVSGSGAQDRLVWLSLKAKRSDNPALQDVTALALKVRADAASTSALQEWQVRSTRVLPYFGSDGQFIEGPTEAIDAAALDICKAAYGLELDDAQIDLPQLRSLAKTWGARNDVICTSIERDISSWEALELVLSAGRTKPEFIGATVTFVRDERRPATRLITPADMVRGSFEVERLHHRRDTPNVTVMRYRDRNGAMRTVTCRPDDVIDAREVVVDDQVMVDHDQIWREGIYRAESNNKRRRYPSWMMVSGGKSLLRGQVVDACHPRPQYGRFGRLLEVAWPRIWLSEETGLASGEEAWLKLSMPDGSPWGPVLVRGINNVANGIEVDEADFASVLNGQLNGSYSMDPRDWIITETNPLVGEGRTETLSGLQAEPTRAAIGTGESPVLRCMIVEVLPSENGQVEVLAIEEVDSVHDIDKGTPPAVANSGSLLTNDDRPIWDEVVIVGTQNPVTSRPYKVDHYIQGPTVPGAIGYVAEWAPQLGLTTWNALPVSSIPSFDGPETDGNDIWIRVAAQGPILRGAWTYYKTDLNTVTAGKSVARLDLIAQEIYG